MLRETSRERERLIYSPRHIWWGWGIPWDVNHRNEFGLVFCQPGQLFYTTVWSAEASAHHLMLHQTKNSKRTAKINDECKECRKISVLDWIRLEWWYQIQRSCISLQHQCHSAERTILWLLSQYKIYIYIYNTYYIDSWKYPCNYQAQTFPSSEIYPTCRAHHRLGKKMLPWIYVHYIELNRNHKILERFNAQDLWRHIFGFTESSAKTHQCKRHYHHLPHEQREFQSR